MNLDGTGDEFVDAEVTTQPPGAEGIIRERPNVDAKMVVQLPDGAECTGGNGNGEFLYRTLTVSLTSAEQHPQLAL